MSDPTREMLEDARLQLDMLREALGVSVEPHQSLFERMMEKARGASLTDTAIADAADDLAATRKQLAEAQARLQSIAEYWNRDENEEAMSDAIWHIIEVAESTETSCLEAARREGEDRVIDKLLAAQANENAARSMCEDFRRQLAEAQADNAAMHSAAHRLALEAECFYLDCKDMALVSKWDDHLQTAISDVQAIRWDGDTSALSAAIAGQQKEIDRLRLMEKNNNERWQHENKSVERMALAAFSVLNHPESPECHFELKQAVMAMGFCPHCEWRPCVCEGQYDD